VCSLAIAGLRIDLIPDDPLLASASRARYAAFGPAPADKGPAARLELWVRRGLDPWPAEALGLAFLATGARLTTPTCRGSIDLAAGRAEVELAGVQALEGLDYFVRVATALLAFEAGGLLLHAAGVLRGGRAHLFVGRSGSGKTTVARLAGAQPVLNDDLVLLMPTTRGWRAYATPFSHPAQVQPSGPLDAPIAALYTLTQDRDVYLKALTGSETLATLVANTPVVNADPARSRRLLARLADLARSTPAWKLHFRPEPSFWCLLGE